MSPRPAECFLDLNGNMLESPVTMKECSVSAATLLTRDLDPPAALVVGDRSVLRCMASFDVFIDSPSS